MLAIPISINNESNGVARSPAKLVSLSAKKHQAVHIMLLGARSGILAVEPIFESGNFAVDSRLLFERRLP